MMPEPPTTVTFELPFSVAWETLNAVVDRRRLLAYVSDQDTALGRLVAAEAILRGVLRISPPREDWTEGELAEAWGR